MPPASPSHRLAVSPSHDAALFVRDLGRMNYADAFDLQKTLQQEVIAWRDSPTTRHSALGTQNCPLGHLLLVEHDPPVITVSRRKTARQHLIATPEMLASAGVEVAETDRGGDITYHGPGQLVVYPILDLNRLHLRLHGYMRFLEQIVIDTLASFSIEGHRDDSATGVWVETSKRQNVKTSKRQHSATNAHGLPPVGSAKICAMGVRVSRWVSMHGLALNVTTNLDHFNLIVPCGLAGRTVTSMERELRDRCPSMDAVKRAIVERFQAASATLSA